MKVLVLVCSIFLTTCFGDYKIPNHLSIPLTNATLTEEEPNYDITRFEVSSLEVDIDLTHNYPIGPIQILLPLDYKFPEQLSSGFCGFVGLKSNVTCNLDSNPQSLTIYGNVSLISPDEIWITFDLTGVLNPITYYIIQFAGNSEGLSLLSVLSHGHGFSTMYKPLITVMNKYFGMDSQNLYNCEYIDRCGKNDIITTDEQPLIEDNQLVFNDIVHKKFRTYRLDELTKVDGVKPHSIYLIRQDINLICQFTSNVTTVNFLNQVNTYLKKLTD